MNRFYNNYRIIQIMFLLIVGILTLPTKGFSWNVRATREGLVGATTANGYIIIANDWFVALPSREGLDTNFDWNPKVRVTYGNRSIIAHVWDYEADILPNTVEVYIRNLRNKIDKPFSRKNSLIQTVRGFGYKIG